MSFMPHHRQALGIATGYGLAGMLWFALCDRFLATLTAAPVFLTRLQTMKGWFFTLVTAMLVSLLSRRALVLELPP